MKGTESFRALLEKAAAQMPFTELHSKHQSKAEATVRSALR
ncbi:MULTISPECIES: hypothetical protein [unclassified Caballeronia]|nr:MULTISPECIES: hypothetical protein [unclassified Caballeronia]